MNFRGAEFQADDYGRNDFGDEQAVRDRWWHVAAGETVVDVGAAVGSYTIPAIALGARVVSLCPQGQHRPQLKANVARNAGFEARSDVLWMGAHRDFGWIKLDGGRYHFRAEQPSDFDDETFAVAPLDWLLSAEPRVDWIKIDVEGHEEHVLAGAERIIRRHRPRLLVENHLFMDGQIQDRVCAWVAALGVGYAVTSLPWNSVSHSFFEVRG